MKLTTQQRIEALEREITVVEDTIKLLHRLLKEHKQLIHDYIVGKIAVCQQNGQPKNDSFPCEEVFTFKCKSRFDKADKDINKLRRKIDGLGYHHKAG